MKDYQRLLPSTQIVDTFTPQNEGREWGMWDLLGLVYNADIIPAPSQEYSHVLGSTSSVFQGETDEAGHQRPVYCLVRVYIVPARHQRRLMLAVLLFRFLHQIMTRYVCASGPWPRVLD